MFAFGSDQWVCVGSDRWVCVGMVEGARFVQFCGHFVNDCIDLIFGFKSIFSSG